MSLYPSSESAEEISFRQLHRTDLAPIHYRRVCSADGSEVPSGEIAKGYEYAKGQFVLITDEDRAKARVEATQAIDVRDFVPATDVPWTFFENAYYVEPEKAGFRAYALLREALRESGRVGIGSVVRFSHVCRCVSASSSIPFAPVAPSDPLLGYRAGDGHQIRAVPSGK